MSSEELDSIRWTSPWQPVKDQLLATELQREIGPGHALAGKSVTAIGRRTDCDDVLFHVADSAKPYAVVHLTWRGRESSSDWPATSFFATVEECFGED